LAPKRRIGDHRRRSRGARRKRHHRFLSVLQNELKGRSTKIVLVAFDLLYLNGYDLRKLPLVERKSLLKKLIVDTDVHQKIAHKGIWAEPSLLAEIEYRAKSAKGKVRHPFFKGLREDI
jgi:ATP-dependent DNA ligase